MDEARHQHPPGLWDTGRVEAFSDGVLAIAITLLVLEIKVVPSELEHLRKALAHEWPQYLAYATSFLTIGSVWVAHHNLYGRLRCVDATMMRLNLLLLMATAFLPFPTGLLAETLRASDEASRTAVGLYGATVLVIDMLLDASVRHAARHPELARSQPPQKATPPPPGRRSWRPSLSVVVYAIAIIVGIFVFPKLAAAAYLAVAVRSLVMLNSDSGVSLRLWTAR
ncbi:MAG: TMEM175 family protein [Solirubrobacteraceae bacterium]